MRLLGGRPSVVVVFVFAALAAACGNSPSPVAATRISATSPEVAATTGFGTLAAASSAPSASTAVDFAACVRGPSAAGCFSADIDRPGAAAAPATAPGAPANLSASAVGGNVTLTWTAPASADPVVSYVIEAGSLPGAANLANFSTGTPATTFLAGGVPAGTYYVRVRGTTSGGTGPASNEAVLVVGGGCPLPGAPGGLAVLTNSGGTVVLVWVVAPNASTYIVEAGSGPGLANLANSDVGPGTTLTATGVGAGTYYVRMRGRNACGVGAPSNEIVLTVGSPTTIPNVSGTWSLSRTGSYPWISTYSTFTVTLVQSGVNLTGSIRPTNGSFSTPIILGNVSASRQVFFGSEHAYWNDLPPDGSDGYFRLTLDSTGRRMSGGCTTIFTCSSATATKISP